MSSDFVALVTAWRMPPRQVAVHACPSTPRPHRPLPVHLPRSIRGNGEVIKRSEFLQRQEVAEAARLARLSKKPKKLASEGKICSDSALLQARPLALFHTDAVC